MVVAQTLLLAACNTEEPPGSDTVVTDSAGVRVVENRGGQDETAASPATLATRDLRIGMRDGPEDYQLAGIRGAARLDDDALVVLNATPPEVRVFGPDGQIERTPSTAGRWYVGAGSI